MPEKAKPSLRQNIRTIASGIKLYSSFGKPVMLSIAASSVFDAAVPFISIYFAAQVLNELAGARDRDRLISLALWTVFLSLAGLLLQKALQRWASYCTSGTEAPAYRLLSFKAMTMDYADIENPATQLEYSQIWQDQWFIGQGLLKLEEPVKEIVQGLIRVILSVFIAASLFTLRVPEGSQYTWLDSPWSVIIVLVVLATPIFLTPYLTVRGGRLLLKSDDGNKNNRSFCFYFFDMNENNDAAKDIRIYDQQRLVWKQIARNSDCNWRNGRTWNRPIIYEGRFNAAGVAVTHLCNGLVFLFVALKALAGAFGVGSIVLYVSAITQFGMGFSEILSKFGQLINNNPYLEKWNKFLDKPNSMRQGDLPVEKRDILSYEIEFRDVSFIYPGNEEYALKDVSLKFRIGQRLAIVGENGSGKTTLIKLLCRLYNPTAGEILLNGIDIRKYDLQQYMEVFSVVFQDFELLPFALGQNIAVSKKYDKERVISSLGSAGFSDRLETMPSSLETYLYKNFEEDGVELSGGEAQKIALARMLYRDAPFIILDEPTAALDPIAEYEVYTKMNDIVGGKTAVFISHRLSSCRFCGDIAVFHKGLLIQRGSHDDLVSDTAGKYYELWNAQAQYYQNA